MTIRVPVDFSAVEEYELVPAGAYSAVVDQLTYIEAKDEDKHPQLQVDYVITEEGEVEGRKLSQWLSFSPKALYRMKAWFDAFDVADSLEDLGVDDESGVVVDPDLAGAVVDIQISIEPHYLDKNRKINRVDGAPVVRSIPKTRAAKPKVSAKVLPRGASRDEDEAPAEKKGVRLIR